MLDQGVIRAKLHGRSFWRLRYADGRTVNEWDTDWTLAPPDGRQSLRLYAPNGQVAQVGNTEDATGRLFQFKSAVMQPGRRETQRHIVGIVTDPSGACDCAAWDYSNQRLDTFKDNVLRFRYVVTAPLNLAVLGIRL